MSAHRGLASRSVVEDGDVLVVAVAEVDNPPRDTCYRVFFEFFLLADPIPAVGFFIEALPLFFFFIAAPLCVHGFLDAVFDLKGVLLGVDSRLPRGVFFDDGLRGPLLGKRWDHLLLVDLTVASLTLP